MSADAETAILRVKSSAEELAKAAVEIQALKEARYRQAAQPVSREGRLGAHLSTCEGTSEGTNEGGSSKQRTSNSKERWDKAILFARQAQHDDAPSSSSSSDGDSIGEESKKKRADRRAKRIQKRKERIEYSKAMDMQYFLEMHRYGSNLRAYHSYWQSQSTLENFFYWLDYGSGRDLNLSVCSRSQLDSECVRYLSREERQSYLVKIDHSGRLCWAKNGECIDTTTKYHDSPTGIVLIDSENAAAAAATESHVRCAHHGARRRSGTIDNMSSSSDSSSSPRGSDSGGERYADPSMQGRHGPKKVFHVSASTVLNRLLRGTTKKNTWIFVVDNSFRLYVGIKQSGAFQHSSFLHGARVSAAGLIKIKDGRLSSLSPLSGHYRPPANNFRKFVKSLKEAGVDMSHVSISKSYAILVGLEAYSNFRKGKNKTKRAAGETADKVVDKIHPSSTPHLYRSKKDENVTEQYQIDKPTRYNADGTADNGRVEKPDKQLKKRISAEKNKRHENSFAVSAHQVEGTEDSGGV
ncbi:hypothetical protein Q9L58_004857 [Maublancomyces gigas]|uniref:IQ calmodulin-binding motif protein n=1 Tax=Discina gigas TaxID=1032678 RepID=A0ABR3GK02_9PEZI